MTVAQTFLAFEPALGQRRVACVILPELACELARWAATQPSEPVTSSRVKDQKSKSTQPSEPVTSLRVKDQKSKSTPQRRVETRAPSERPLGVVLMDGVDRKATLSELNRAIEPNFRLAAVDARARQLGIIEGQTIIEARCLHAALEVNALPRRMLAETLSKLAESLLDRASIVAVEAPDTIWLEIGPVMQALGGEAAIAKEVIERVRCLGHAVRLAVASGPRLAQLLARWSPMGQPHGLIVPQQRTIEMVQALPLAALPLNREQLGWLGRLGLVKLGDLRRLPEGELVQRLGRDSERWVALARGQDNEPLFAIQPERILRERLEWEEPVEGLDRLRFVLRRLTTNLEARLAGRGEAAERLSIIWQHDRSIARHRGVSEETHLQLELARPLWYAEDLERIILARCERLHWAAPMVALELRVIAPTPKKPQQLELSRLAAGYAASRPAEEGLPVLLAELEVEIGIERVGLLRLGNSHRPEAKSLFSPCRLDDLATPMPTSMGARQSKPGKSGVRKSTPRARLEPASAGTTTDEPARLMSSPANSNAERADHPRHPLAGVTRFFERPIAIEPPLRVGATLFLEHQAYVIERAHFEQRLEQLEWWGKQPVSRDYWRLMLRGATGEFEALAYVEPPTGHCFVQAVVD